MTAGAAFGGVIRWHACPSGARGGYSAAVMHCGDFISGDRIHGRRVHLRITRLQARPEGPTRHPVIYVPGGPGDAGGQRAPVLRAWRRFQQAAGWPRDLVIFDPRGTGKSAPRPVCPSRPDATPAGRLAACFARLGAGTAGRLGATAQVADLHRLITALAPGGAVIWAESYGALIAGRLAAGHPGDVRLLILDSPVLRPRPERDRQAAALRRRRRQLRRACARTLSCRLAVPSLRATIPGLLASRARHPVTITVAQPPGSARSVTIDGRTLGALLLLSAYGRPEDARVVRMLRRAVENPGALGALAGPLLALRQHRSRTAPVYWSTRCQFAARPMRRDGRTAAAACRQWPVPRLAPVRHAEHVPTLLVAGTRDVFTPAAAAARAVLAHPGWQFLPVVGGGHGVIRGNACAQRVAARFIARQGAWLGVVSCAGQANGGARSPRRVNERGTNDAEPLRR
ncbi:alpha/beta hydrolase [Salinisphaera sp. RV14]|uniref:alpha/beta hydrolase n=1 Tax=Salinisphaera sp. RV14 TaxID=3454140 RepID=UPI003F86C6DE